ncbi:MAG: hypothetical protein F6J86_31225 [Symploca sp. SIO1B1]|nr:hypothetical protein [Symploca sp. SIO1B1]
MSQRRVQIVILCEDRQQEVFARHFLKKRGFKGLLAFAWTSSLKAPLILGQTNCFMEFDVCFYRSKMEFEIKPKSQ